jgi:hypothetical protein
MSQKPSQTVTLGASLVSNPVPVIINFVPPQKLPLDGDTDNISSVDVNVAVLQESPRASL